MKLKAASCFSGIGAPELGGPQFDWLWSAEIEKFPSAVLANRFPHSVNLGDVTADDFLQNASRYGKLDLLVGGPPCQDFSVAGLRAGMAGDRGNLTLRFLEIAHAIRPRNLLVENVPGWLSMPDNAFGSFLAGIVGADDTLRSPVNDGRWPSVGMVTGPRARAAWRVFDAQYFGVAQRRRRVFVVVDFGEGADPASVLFERKGMFGNTPPRREKGQGTARTISARTKGGGGLGADFEIDGGLTVTARMTAIGEYIDDDTASTVKARDYKDATELVGFVALYGGDNGNGACSGIEAIGTLCADSSIDGVQSQYGEVAGTLTSRHDSSPCADRGQNIIAFSSKDYGNDATDDLSPTLRAMNHAGSHANGGGQVAVAFSENQQGAVYEADVLQALNRGGGKPGQSYPAIRVGLDDSWQVRRLTPIECERLQGFPDGWTDVPYRGKKAADGPRYKSLGNSWAVPCGAWIIGRIAERLIP